MGDTVYVGTVLDVRYGDWDTDDPWVEFTVHVERTCTDLDDPAKTRNTIEAVGACQRAAAKAAP